MNIEKVKKIMDMLPEVDRMTIIKIYKDWWTSEPQELPKKVKKLLDIYSMLTPEEQKMFDENCKKSESDGDSSIKEEWEYWTDKSIWWENQFKWSMI
jgi:CHAD domain-containing protein